MAIHDDFVPVVTQFTRDDPRLASLDKEELIMLLPDSIQKEVRRAEWAWANIDNLAFGFNHDPSQVVIDPFSQGPVSERVFSRDEILLLFDPTMPDEDMPEEDLLLGYMAGDPVIWSRINLKINPRIYQTLILRDPSTRKVLRLGRRCGKSAAIAIDMIHKCRVNDGYICMLIAPMKSQCEVVWNMIKDLLSRNEEYQEELRTRKIRTREQPYYEMTFPNGSIIKMFTSGVKSNNKGDSIRGQEADSLYLDEVDLMNPDDRPAFSAILRDTGRPFIKTMIVASTPNGRRDMLYEYSTLFRDPSKTEIPFTEYHFPTHADLNYKPKDDNEQKSILTNEGYQHEILAIYGEETSGVFLKAHLERAQEHYEGGYEYLSVDDFYRPPLNTRLVVGVDWDKYGAGVNIVMCAANYNPRDNDDPSSGRLKPIARWEVPRSPETLTQATDFIKTINALYHPDAIYIDRGYGDMQYEELTLAAKKADKPGGDRRCLGLDKVLHGVHFAEKITIYDPITSEEVGKEVKDYMITLTIKMFEEDQIILNSRDHDEVPGPTDMIKQMEGYQIVRRTSTGRPVYEAGSTSVGDHALDAFMLCILAMHQEWGSFTNAGSHAHPKTFNFNLYDIMSSEGVNLRDGNDELPDRFSIRRTNIKAGRPSRGGGGRMLRRKSF